ncbi:MAG TPA: cupin domain-containing protein [Candidatus Dormibacteraeota bacterium]|jgi:mannose-6-phosphate isomerase-like protein (cupin superfamily)
MGTTLTTIARDELRIGLDAGSLAAVDARAPTPYGLGHLPGAINVIADDPDDRVQELLPDRNAAIATYGHGGDDADRLAVRLRALGYADVRTYREGIEDWVGAGLPLDRPRPIRTSLAELATNPTAALFEGHRRAGVDFAMFVVRTLPGRFVELHVHPYAETFLLLEGRGRWTRGDEVVELEREEMIVVPPDTPHGFRNVGDVPLLVVSIHERGTLRQRWLGREPA